MTLTDVPGSCFHNKERTRALLSVVAAERFRAGAGHPGSTGLGLTLDRPPARWQSGGMVKFTVRLPDDLHEQVQAAAANQERSLNGEVVWLLRLGLDTSQKGERSSTSAAPAEGGAR